MYVNFEFAALLPSPYNRGKKCAKFKTNIHLVSVDSFLYYLSSSALFWRSLRDPDYRVVCLTNAMNLLFEIIDKLAYKSHLLVIDMSLMRIR